MADVYETLLKAIKEHSGMEESEIIEAGEHGADTGWAGFSYYKDTGEFYEKYEDAIWELLEQQAEDMGEKHPLALIAAFKGAQDVHGADQFENLLAWFALEEVGHWLADKGEEGENEPPAAGGGGDNPKDDDGIRPYGPGKFDSIIDEYVYALSGEGWTHEEVGDVQGFGWFGSVYLGSPEAVKRVKELAAEAKDTLTAEEEELIAESAGAIISEDDQGFVGVTYYDSENELKKAWVKIEQAEEEFYAEEEGAEQENAG